ncbi:MAG: hypothetical protein P4K98_08010 [Bryobacteraceae bacterium]|nr:hypothetical protein [Bryobacteraceae bacterium]
MSVQPQQWEYVFITRSNTGKTIVQKPNGDSGIVPNEPIIVTLNKFGQEGWELVKEQEGRESAQGNVALDQAGSSASNGVTSTTYIMRRPVPSRTEESGISAGVL